MKNKYFLEMDVEKIPGHLKTSSAMFRIDSMAEAMAFLTDEAIRRGFFLGNDLNQLKEQTKQLPLLTWPFLDFFKTLDVDNKRLIELGSGNSTKFFAEYFKNVISFETSSAWYSELKPNVPKNVELNYLSVNELIELELDYQKDDFLLVDFAGPRTKFIDHMLKQNMLPGVVVLDNSDWYRNGASLLANAGFYEVPFFGCKSGQRHLSCTSVFYRDSEFLLKNSPFLVTPQNCRILHNAWDEI